MHAGQARHIHPKGPGGATKGYKISNLSKYVPRDRRHLTILILILLTLSIAGCSAGGQKASKNEIILATTTSTYDSGLLDKLLPAFSKRHGYTVKPLAVGTGEALAMGERGDADVLLVHAPEAEEAFMTAGHGRSRRAVMFNWFLLLGPKDDPADVGKANSVTGALGAIFAEAAPFVSRGDDSGTHKKELSLWEMAGLEPISPWHQEVGQGMGATLRIADNKEAYTLTDEATFRAQEWTLSLRAFDLEDPRLMNKYSVIVVEPPRPELGNPEGAEVFGRWLAGQEGQDHIADFRAPGDNDPLFIPENTGDDDSGR